MEHHLIECTERLVYKGGEYSDGQFYYIITTYILETKKAFCFEIIITINDRMNHSTDNNRFSVWIIYDLKNDSSPCTARVVDRHNEIIRYERRKDCIVYAVWTLKTNQYMNLVLHLFYIHIISLIFRMNNQRIRQSWEMQDQKMLIRVYAYTPTTIYYPNKYNNKSIKIIGKFGGFLLQRSLCLIQYSLFRIFF